MIIGIWIFDLIIIINKSEVWIIIHCLRLGYGMRCIHFCVLNTLILIIPILIIFITKSIIIVIVIISFKEFTEKGFANLSHKHSYIRQSYLPIIDQIASGALNTKSL